MYLICNSQSAFLLLSIFLNSWQPESKFPFSQVRLPPKEGSLKLDFAENQEIEVYSRANEQEACGWWKAVIKVRVSSDVCFLLGSGIDLLPGTLVSKFSVEIQKDSYNGEESRFICHTRRKHVVETFLDFASV